MNRNPIPVPEIVTTAINEKIVFILSTLDAYMSLVLIVIIIFSFKIVRINFTKYLIAQLYVSLKV